MTFGLKIIQKYFLLSATTVFAVILFCLSTAGFGQMNVSASSSAAALAQAIAGSGVTVSNASLNCGPGAAGTFTYAGANLGISGGILLSTGNATDVANGGSFFCSVNNGNNFSDPDLTAIVPAAHIDACVLEFNFVPTCNTLNMTYVFGSEEYPTGVNQQYNDAFAIFLTGPNPSGGNYSAVNIATLPNATPVSIHNINAGMNSSYFHNNYTSPNNDVAYNGYTVPVTSATSIVPCSTYKMKIAIADAGNALYDSGVFINGNGVSCQNPASISATTTPTSCGNTGNATVSVTNFTGTVTYQWHPGGQTTASINNLGAGTYTCVVGLHQTCGVINQTVTATVSSVGNNMVLTANQQPLTCQGASNASATVTPVGGSSPYTCVWNTSPVQTGLVANNLSAGSYSATVTDNAGCQSVIQVNITQPAAMQLSFTTTPAACTSASGAATVSVTANGTAPYSYSWNTAPVQNSQTATNVASGVYTVTVTDAHNCSVTGNATVAVQNPSWSASITTTNVACFGGNTGAAAVALQNATGLSFTYSWSPSSLPTVQTLSNLAAGYYTCTVTDNNGCAKALATTIAQPSLLVISMNTSPTYCTGSVGSANAIVSGGTAPYSYFWNTTPQQNLSTAQNLAQGQYGLQVVDAHNCVATATANVGAVNPSLQISSSVINSACGGPSGSISILSITPSAPPFSYSWITGQNTQTINNLSPGIYVVSVTDTNGCSGQASIAVNINPVLPVTTSTSPDFCKQGIGQASAMANGTPPYQYQWNTPVPQTTQTAANLMAGSYQLIVSDAFDCKDTTLVTVTNTADPFAPSLATPIDQVYVDEQINIAVNIDSTWTLSGGSFSDGTAITNVNVNHVFLVEGDYYATYDFTSVHGCKDSVTYEIHVKNYSTFYVPNSFTPNSDGVNDLFKAEGTLIKSFEIYVYDNWGNLVWKTDDLTKGWDGKYKGQEAPQGVYVYEGTAIDFNGEENNFKGQINLIR